MIPKEKTNTEEKTKKNIFVSILGLILMISAVYFTAIGAFMIFRAFFTDYNIKTLDLVYFASGILFVFSITIVNLLTEIRDQNKTIAKGVLHLLKQKIQTNNNFQSPESFGDVIKNLFGKQPGLSEDDISGSISLYDMSDPDNPIFQGDFTNSTEMGEVRKNLIEEMLNSQKEFKGKKITKQEMLDKSSLRELKTELKIAVEAEDWLWAASIRDKIAEKEKNKKGGSKDSEKNINPDL